MQVDFERLEPNTVFMCKTIAEMDKLKPHLDAIGKKFGANNDYFWNKLKSAFDEPIGFCVGDQRETLTYSRESYFRNPPSYCHTTFHIINVSEIEFENEEEQKMNFEEILRTHGGVIVHNDKERDTVLQAFQDAGYKWMVGDYPTEWAPLASYPYAIFGSGTMTERIYYQDSHQGSFSLGIEFGSVQFAEATTEPESFEPEEYNGYMFNIKQYFQKNVPIATPELWQAKLLLDYLLDKTGKDLYVGGLRYKWKRDLRWRDHAGKTTYLLGSPADGRNSFTVSVRRDHGGPNIIRFEDVVKPKYGATSFEYEQTDDNKFIVNGETMTEEEFDQRFVICDDCGNAIPKENVQEIGGVLVCMDCALSNHSICSKCGEWICDGDEIEIDDEIFCDDCAGDVGFCCAYCNEWHFNSDGVYMEDTGNTFCSDCASDNAYRCYDCGNWYEREDNIYYRDRDGRDYCESCYDDHCHSDAVLGYHSHNMHQADVFYIEEGEKRGETVILGAEHEVDDVDDMDGMVQDLQDEFEDFYVFEEDGSLGDRGVEIISYPASLSEHLKRLPDLRRICRNYGAVSHNSGNCGLHIHIDRQYLSRESDIAKLCFLFERHWDNLVIFARRTNDQLHWCRKNRDEYGDASPAQIAKRDKDGNNPTRYCAINLTNSHTVEIRLWRGTLNLLTMKATFKLTARLAELAKNTPIAKLYKMKWEDILGDDEDIKAYWATRVPATVEGAYDPIVEENDDPGEED